MMKIRNFGNFCILVLAANCFLVCSGASVNGTGSNSTQIQMLNGSTTTSSSVASNSNKSSDDSQEINLAEIMQKCNETAKVTTGENRIKSVKELYFHALISFRILERAK